MGAGPVAEAVFEENIRPAVNLALFDTRLKPHQRCSQQRYMYRLNCKIGYSPPTSSSVRMNPVALTRQSFFCGEAER